MKVNDKEVPNPGSNEAIEQRCRCPILDNNHGRGAWEWGEGVFVISEDCPLHDPWCKGNENVVAHE